MMTNVAMKLKIAVHDTDHDWRVDVGALADGISVTQSVDSVLASSFAGVTIVAFALRESALRRRVSERGIFLAIIKLS